VQRTLNAGASIHATVRGRHATTGVFNAGASIEAFVSRWVDFGRIEGTGIADYSNETGRATSSIDIGLSDDGSPTGETDNLHSPGETD
jgi:hypothetical protein